MRLLRPLVFLLLSLPLFADDLTDAIKKAIEDSKTPPASAQGDALYGEKKYDEAAKAYVEHVTRRPDDSGAWYNLACCLALAGRKTDAVTALDMAVKTGFKDLSHIKADPDLDSLRKKKSFKAILKTLTPAGPAPKIEWVAGESIWPVSVQMPKDFDAKKQYGLILLLHGRGDTAQNFLAGVGDWGNGEFIIASIETPYTLDLGGGRVGRCWSPWESGKDNAGTAYKLSASTVGRALEMLTTKYAPDAKRVFLVGFSEGAYMAAHCALVHSDKLAGAVVISGGLDPKLVTKEDYAKAKGVRILVAHGVTDGVVPFGNGKKLVEALETHEVPCEFFPFEGGHTIPQAVRDGVDAWVHGKEIPEELKAEEPK